MNTKNLFKNIEQKVKAAEYKLGLIADYVVETGTSDIWTYAKWQSGKAECWGKARTTLENTGTLWSNPLYAYTNTTRPSYPFTFLEPPMEIAQVVSSANAMWIYKQASESNSTTMTSSYALIKVSAFDANSTADISYYVNGRWK